MAAESPLVAYPIRIPFAVDVPDGAEVTVQVAGEWANGRIDQPSVTLRFGVVPANALDLSVAQFKWLEERGSESPLPQTADLVAGMEFIDYVIEAETGNEFVKGDPRDSTKAIFERCLRAVNQFLWAYMVATEDPAVRFLTVEMLDSMQVADYRTTPARSEGRVEVHVMSAHIPGHLAENRQVTERIDYLGLALHNFEFSHPMGRARIWLTKSRHALGEVGDYEQSVLYLEVAAEALMSAVEERYLVDLGRSFVEVEEALNSKRSFGQFLSRMQAVLGGNWNGQGSGAVGAFSKVFYELRNRIAHRAEHISYEDVESALRAYEAFEAFLLERVLSVRSKYPRIAFGVYGRAGLQRAGALDKRMAEFARGQEGIPGPFWAPIDQRRVGWDVPRPEDKWMPPKSPDVAGDSGQDG